MHLDLRAKPPSSAAPAAPGSPMGRSRPLHHRAPSRRASGSRLQQSSMYHNPAQLRFLDATGGGGGAVPWSMVATVTGGEPQAAAALPAPPSQRPQLRRSSSAANLWRNQSEGSHMGPIALRPLPCKDAPGKAASSPLHKPPRLTKQQQAEAAALPARHLLLERADTMADAPNPTSSVDGALALNCPFVCPLMRSPSSSAATGVAGLLSSTLVGAGTSFTAGSSQLHPLHNSSLVRTASATSADLGKVMVPWGTSQTKPMG